MLQMMQDLKGDAIVATDGRVGSVQDVYFDDERWAVRYLVVDTREWWPGGEVLISPTSVPQGQDPEADTLRVSLTREQVKRAPGAERDRPVSRLLEIEHARYYGYPCYWTGPYLWGAAPVPPAAAGLPQTGEPAAEEARRMAEKHAQQSHIRSGVEVVGYRIEAADGEIGHVEDFLVDDETWAITHMVVDARNWLPGRKVLVRPREVADIDWDRRRVSVRLTRDQVL